MAFRIKRQKIITVTKTITTQSHDYQNRYVVERTFGSQASAGKMNLGGGMMASGFANAPITGLAVISILPIINLRFQYLTPKTMNPFALHDG